MQRKWILQSCAILWDRLTSKYIYTSNLQQSISLQINLTKNHNPWHRQTRKNSKCILVKLHSNNPRSEMVLNKTSFFLYESEHECLRFRNISTTCTTLYSGGKVFIIGILIPSRSNSNQILIQKPINLSSVSWYLDKMDQKVYFNARTDPAQICLRNHKNEHGGDHRFDQIQRCLWMKVLTRSWSSSSESFSTDWMIVNSHSTCQRRPLPFKEFHLRAMIAVHCVRYITENMTYPLPSIYLRNEKENEY